MPTLRYSLLLALAVMAAPFVATAQDRGCFTPVGTYKPTFSLTESRTDAVVTGEVVTTHSTTVSSSVSVTGIDTGLWNETTPFSVGVGSLNYTGTLGDDPAYTVGKKSISIPMHGFNFETGKPLGASFLKLSWTAKTLTVTFTASSKSNNPDMPLLPAVYQGGGTIPKLRITAPVSLTIGTVAEDSISGETRIFIQGSATESEKVVAGTPYQLASHKITGALDLAAPVITIKTPAKGARFVANHPFGITGMVKDSYDVIAMEVTDSPLAPEPIWIGGVALEPGEIPNGQEWEPPNFGWTHEVALLPPGDHAYGFRTTDSSGNVSPITVVRFTVIPEFNAIAAIGGFKPVIKATASYTERGVKVGTDVVTMVDGKGTFSMTASMDGAALSSLNANTELTLMLGATTFTAKLGDDPAYKPGKTSATLRLVPQENNLTTIKLSWTAKALTITATFAGTGTVGQLDFGLFEWVRAMVGTPDPDFRTLVPATFSFGTHNGSTSLYTTLKSTVTPKTVSGTDLRLNAVTGTGVNDTQAPQVTLLSPAPGGSLQTGSEVIIKGKLSEGFKLAAIQWAPDFENAVQGPADIPFTKTSTKPVFDSIDEWGAVAGTWEVAIPFNAIGGSGQVWIRAVDHAGNVSAPFSVTWNKPFTLPSLAGAWHGVFQRPETQEDPVLAATCAVGRITMTSTDKGIVSGKLALFPLMTEDAPFTGIIYQQHDTAELHAKLRLGKTGPLVRLAGILTAESTAPDHVFAIEITDLNLAGITYASGILRLTPYSAKNPVPDFYLGLFNGAIDAAFADLSQLNKGYLSASLTKSGTVNVTGRLADGAAILWSGPVAVASIAVALPDDPHSRTLAISLSTPLYGGLSAFGGMLSLAPIGDDLHFSADRLLWFRTAHPNEPSFPSGIDATATLTGGKYTPFDSSTATGLHLSATGNTYDDSDLSIELDLPFHNTTGVLLAPSPNPSAIKAKLDLKTGLFTSSYLAADGKTVDAAALYIPETAGIPTWQGHLIAPPATGQVTKRFGSLTLSPNPK